MFETLMYIGCKQITYFKQRAVSLFILFCSEFVQYHKCQVIQAL